MEHRSRATRWVVSGVAVAALAMGAAMGARPAGAVENLPEPGSVSGPACHRLLDLMGEAVPERFSWLGLGLTRPTGAAWADSTRLTCSDQGGAGLLTLARRPIAEGHTVVVRAGFVADAESLGLDAGSSADELLDAATRQTAESGGPREGQRWESFAVTGSTTRGGQPCRTWEATAIDDEVPGEVGVDFRIDDHGMYCAMPADEGLVVGVDWSERYRDGVQQRSPEVAREAASWLTGLGILEPDTDWIVDDFSGDDDVFGPDSTDQWTARSTGRAYQLRFLDGGTTAGRTTRVRPAQPSLGVELAMRIPRTGGSGEQHGPICLAPDQGPGYLFVVSGDPSGPAGWELGELTSEGEFVEHATGTVAGKLRPGSWHPLRIECTTAPGGATTVRGFVDGEEVARHVVDGGVPAFGSAGFVARAGESPFALTVDDFVVSVPPDRPADPAALPGSTERLLSLLAPVEGFQYGAPVLVGPWIEAMASRGVFGDPHIDRWVDLPSGETVGVLVLAEPEGARGDTEADLDALVELAWEGIGRDVETVSIAGQPVRKLYWPELGMWVYTWLDRGVYAEFLANEPRVTDAEAFLTSFIAAQRAAPA